MLAEDFPEIYAVYRDIEKPHKALHASGRKIEAALNNGNTDVANTIYGNETRLLLEQVSSGLNKVTDLTQKRISAVQHSRSIFENQSVPALNQVRELLDTIADKLGALAKGEQQAMHRQGSYLLRTTTIIALIAIFAGIILSVFITRSILCQLGGEPSVLVNVTQKIAAGDLSVKLDVKPNDHHSLFSAIAEMTIKLRHIVSDVRAGATNLSSASREVSATSQTLSHGAAQQAAGAEEISATVEQLRTSVQRNAESASVTEKISVKASDDADKGAVVINRAVASMKDIAEKVKSIEQLAYKTNLLSLNAAIEAARAGEHGKGFAVVASEVRKLADNSRITAQDIIELAASNVRTAEEAGTLFEQLVPDITKTADLIQEISAASSEQSSGVSQINEAMVQLDTAIQTNASASEEMAATAEELSAQAESLLHLVGYFTLVEESSASTVSLKG